MKTKLATTRNYKFKSHPTHTERGGGLSSTVPDQAYSIREILENNSIRAKIPVFHSHYTGDHDIPDVNSMDLVEIDEAREYFTSSVKKQKEDLNASKKRKKDLEEQLEDEKIERFLKKKAPDKTDDPGPV